MATNADRGPPTAREQALPAGLTPRLLSREQAAAFCGISVLQTVVKSVQPIRLGDRVLWNRKAIDRWLDQQCGLGDGTATGMANGTPIIARPVDGSSPSLAA